MMANHRVELDLHLSESEKKAASWTIADTDGVGSQLERGIYSIRSNEQI